MRQRPRHAKTMQKTNKPDLLHVLHANPTLSNILLLPPQLKNVFISSSHFCYFYSVPTCLAPGPARGRLDDLFTQLSTTMPMQLRALADWCKMSREETWSFILECMAFCFVFVLWPLEVVHSSYVRNCLLCTKFHALCLGLELGFTCQSIILPRCSGTPRASLVKPRKSK